MMVYMKNGTILAGNMRNKIAAAFDSIDKILVWMFLLAFCLRLAWAVFVAGLDYFPPGDDAPNYFEYARNLVAGKGYIAEGGRAFRAPGYPFFLAAVFYVFGESNSAVKIVQCVVSSLIPVLVCLIGLQVSTRRVAVAAGLYTCVYYGLVNEPSRYMTEATFTFLFTLTVWLFLRAREKPRAAAAAGAALGLMLLTRPVGILSLPVFLAWLWLVLDRRTFVRRAAVIAAACLLTLAPWWIRNYRVFHAFVPFNTQFLITGQVEDDKVAPTRYEKIATNEYGALMPRDGRQTLMQVGVQGFWKQGFERMATFFYPFVPGFDITWFFLLPFWLVGMYAALRQGNRPAYILFNLAIYFPMYFFISATTRYKYSVSPFIIVFASMGFYYLYEKYRAGRKYYAVLLAWTAANLAVWLYAPWFRALALKAKGF